VHCLTLIAVVTARSRPVGAESEQAIPTPAQPADGGADTMAQ
jgi:hypothetical protein